MELGKLAILGGEKAVENCDSTLKQATQWPQLGSDYLESVKTVFDDGNITTHPVIRKLEQAYTNQIGTQFALAHNNGTSALMAAFWALDLKPGDQILVPTATFWASVLPMMWHGIVPVFCESEGSELGLDLDDVKSKYNSKVKAIVMVPLWGVPGNYGPILEFAKSKELKVIEDASHAHGATYNGQAVGSFGDIAVFSLQGDKLAPAGEGGMLLTNDEALYHKAILFGDITRIIELETPDRRFAATSFGIKTRIAPVSAAIGLQSLNKLNHNNAIRKENMVKLSQALECYGFNCYQDTSNWSRTYFEFIARYSKTSEDQLDLEEWIKALTSEGCEVTAPRYPLVHEQPFFTEGAYKKVLRIADELCPEYQPGGFEKTRKINSELLKFPCFTTPNNEILDQYIQAIHKIGKAQKELKNKLNLTENAV